MSHIILANSSKLSGSNLGLRYHKTIKCHLRLLYVVILALEENNTINSEDDHKLSDAVNILIELRNQARDNKDFQTSDLIRDQLKEAGIHLKDGKDGTTFSLNI